MKFIQTDNQVTITEGGGLNTSAGVLFTLIGVAVAIFGFSGKATSTNQSASTHSGLTVTVVGLVFFLIGLAIFLTARKQRTVITKGGDTVITSKRVIGGGGERDATFPTANISRVVLQTSLSAPTGRNSQRVPQSELTLILQDNSRIVVATKSRSGGLTMNGLNLGGLLMKAPLSGEAQKLTDFLGVPLETTDSTTLAGAVEAAREVIADARGEQPTTPGVTPGAVAPSSVTPILAATPQQTTATPPVNDPAPKP